MNFEFLADTLMDYLCEENGTDKTRKLLEKLNVGKQFINHYFWEEESDIDFKDKN